MDVTALSPISTISPNYTTRVGVEDYMNSDKNLKKDAEEKRQEALENPKKEQSDTPMELSVDEQRLVNDLKARDSEVRAHEAAHKSAGAATGAASYTYQEGPDGRMYAIGGEVSVSMKGGSTPEETISNAQAIISAAMAPANPSQQDYAVASNARMMMMKAQQEKAKEMQDPQNSLDIYKKEQTPQEEIQSGSSMDISA